MKIIGLTGNIGSGKSTVSRQLKKRGMAIIDADKIAREVVIPPSPLLKQIADHFGNDVFWPDGSLNRSALGTRIFNNPADKNVLESILHPAITREMQSQIAQLKRVHCPVVILDIPLLFETGQEELCDWVWLVIADDDKRMARVTARDGLSLEQACARDLNQMSQTEKKRRADVWIDNNYLLEDLSHQVEELYHEASRKAVKHI